jgi:hypothetical protein
MVERTSYTYVVPGLVLADSYTEMYALREYSWWKTPWG